MLDVVTMVLSFVSLIKDIKKRATLSEKVAQLRNALAHVDDIFDLLLYAKECHDQYSALGLAAVAPLDVFLRNLNKAPDDVVQQLEGFMSLKGKLIKQPAMPRNSAEK